MKITEEILNRFLKAYSTCSVPGWEDCVSYCLSYALADVPEPPFTLSEKTPGQTLFEAREGSRSRWEDVDGNSKRGLEKEAKAILALVAAHGGKK